MTSYADSLMPHADSLIIMPHADSLIIMPHADSLIIMPHADSLRLDFRPLVVTYPYC